MARRFKGMPAQENLLATPRPGRIIGAPTAAPPPAAAKAVRDSRQRALPPERRYRGGPSINVGFRARTQYGGP